MWLVLDDGGNPIGRYICVYNVRREARKGEVYSGEKCCQKRGKLDSHRL